MRFIYIFMLALAASLPLRAHHQGDPGSSPATAAVLTPHLLAEGQISLSWSYEMTVYPELSAAELESRTRAKGPGAAILAPFSVGTQSLDLGLGIYAWLQLDVALRATRMETLREGHLHGDGSFGVHELGSPAGLANTELRLKARLVHGEGWSVAALLGATLPTGQDQALERDVHVDASADTGTGEVAADAELAYLGPAFQPGSGATAGTVALAASREFGLWELDASATAVIPAAYHGYKAGNSLALGLALGRLFGEEGHESGYAGLELAATQAEGSNSDGHFADDGGLTLVLGPRLRLPLGARGLATLGVSVPVAKPAGLEPAPLLATNASLQLAF